MSEGGREGEREGGRKGEREREILFQHTYIEATS